MVNDAAQTVSSPLPPATRVADPQLRLSEIPFGGVLSSLAACRLRWLIPPLAVLQRGIRLCAAPRYFGLERVPKSPWPPFHLAVLAGAGAAYQWWLLTPAQAALLLQDARGFLTPDAGQPVDPGLWPTILTRSREILAQVAGYLGDHAEVVWWVLLIYLGAFSLAHLLLAVDRVRTRYPWNRILEVFLLLRGAAVEVAVRRRRQQQIWNLALLILTCLLLASAAVWAPGFPPVTWRWPLFLTTTIGKIALGGSLLLAWLIVLTVFLSRRLDPFARPAAAAAEPPREESLLPHLTLDGRTPLAQMNPIEPIRSVAHPLDERPRRRRGHCFASLFALDRSEEFHYLPGGNVAGPVTVIDSVLRIPVGQELFADREDDEDVSESWLLPTPLEVARTLLEILYLAASIPGRLSKRHNSVIRDFCLSHELCLFLSEEDLSETLLALAADDWSTLAPEEVSARIQAKLGWLEHLPLVDDYLRQWREFNPGVVSRRKRRDFDPLLKKSFRSLSIEFGRLGHLLIEAVVFADRRVDGNEFVLLEKLDLLGDFDSVVAKEEAPGSETVDSVLATGTERTTDAATDPGEGNVE